MSNSAPISRDNAGGISFQAFSYAGKSKGFEDTRGTLFFEFARAIHVVQPKIAIGENVRGSNATMAAGR